MYLKTGYLGYLDNNKQHHVGTNNLQFTSTNKCEYNLQCEWNSKLDKKLSLL